MGLLKTTLDFLAPIREKVLDGVHLERPGRILDVGCGDGLIGIGALQRFPDSTVIFSDISQDLLDHLSALIAELGLLGRSTFLKMAAEDLTDVANETVDAVTMRSVLIYVRDKQRAFAEFHRVLRQGGWLSIFEPVNRFMFPEPDDLFFGYDVSSQRDSARKVKRVYCPDESWQEDPMMDFDGERLVDISRRAGFDEVNLLSEVRITKKKDPIRWETFAKVSPNANAPSFGDAIRSALGPAAGEFTAHLAPLVEAGEGTQTFAGAYLSARRGKDA
jgi:ubiquinone/menaquinone biosynthesis C-methylase UbiE